MIRLYYADISELDDTRPRPELSSYRREKLAKLQNRTLRQQETGAELLLIQAVRDLIPEAPLPLRIGTERNGKPFLQDLPYFFSLSHSGTLAACSIADRAIGLDVQIRRQVTPAFIKRCFTEEEQLYLERSDSPVEAFTMLWTRKESLLKMTGEGLARSLNSFSVLEDNRFWNMVLGEYCFCIYTESGERPDQVQRKKLL